MNKKFYIALGASMLLAATAWASDSHHGDKGDSHDKKAHWGYMGAEGPENWGGLSAAYETCKSGTSQSPINISVAPHKDADGLKISYQPTPMSVLNNGHTIQVNYASGSSMTVDGKTYELLQFHFHSPSEHTYKGSPYPLEAHLVHKAADGSLAVVGVLIKEGAKDNPVLASVWSHMPKEAGGTMEMASMSVNVADLLPAKKAYWNYSGSLTTPPCSEGVNWFVMDKSVEASAAQIKQFLTVVHENARPTQPMNGRGVDHRM